MLLHIITHRNTLHAAVWWVQRSLQMEGTHYETITLSFWHDKPHEANLLILLTALPTTRFHGNVLWWVCASYFKTQSFAGRCLFNIMQTIKWAVKPPPGSCCTPRCLLKTLSFIFNQTSTHWLCPVALFLPPQIRNHHWADSEICPWCWFYIQMKWVIYCEGDCLHFIAWNHEFLIPSTE